MAYFPPYIDSAGLHMPTYEERLSSLTESYRAIYGQESELSESVPDYQLLSVISRSLDDASALILSAVQSVNPQYAQGPALDLMLPMYGLSRQPGETDASVRSRMLTAIARNDLSMEQAIMDEIWSVPNVRKAVLYINETSAADDKGIPAHSLCAVVYNGNLQKLAEALFRSKPPGIRTYGNSTKQVVDDYGVSHDIQIYRPTLSYITFDIFLKTYDGFDNSLLDTIRQAITSHLNGFDIGQSLNVSSIYGVCYAAAGNLASTFAITDLAATATAAGGTTRIRVPADWKTKLDADPAAIYFNVTAA